MSERVFNPDTYSGHDGIRRFYDDVSDVWAEYRWVPEEVHESEDQVVALLHVQGRGQGSGLEIDRHVAWLWALRDGRAVRAKFYPEPEEALRAAGIDA